MGKRRRRRKKKLYKVIILLAVFIGILAYRNGFLWINNYGAKRIFGTNILLVNREHKLRESYEPSDLVRADIDFLQQSTDEEHYMRKGAAEAIKSLVNGAKDDGIIIKGLSGYRSYGTQKDLYNFNVEVQGQSHADLYVAMPGASEHQTGEAMDVGVDYGEFEGSSKEGIWLANNAYKYGFIIRYPEDKTDITGYNYEPWHVRYVGKIVAKKIYDKHITLEEYDR